MAYKEQRWKVSKLISVSILHKGRRGGVAMPGYDAINKRRIDEFQYLFIVY